MFLNNNNKYEIQKMQKEFLDSCKKADLETYLDKVKSLSYDGVDVNAENGKESGLSIASKNGYQKLLEFLLSQPNIDVNIKMKAGFGSWYGPRTGNGKWTPLMFACAYGQHEVVKRLIQVPNIDLRHRDDDGYTALHWAASNGHDKCVKVLATVKSLDWNCKDNKGGTPLFLALWYDRVDCVRIISRLPDINFNVKTRQGQSLAQAAVIGSSVECVKILAGIDGFLWSDKDQFGDSPLMTTLKKGKKEMFDILVNCPRVDLSLRDSNGDTPAMWAHKNGLIDQAKKLERLSPSRAYDLSKMKAALPKERKKKVPECPICMNPFARDGRIFHCVSGHFICQACKPSLVSPVCPKCKQAFSGRAHDFEEIVKENFY